MNKSKAARISLTLSAAELRSLKRLSYAARRSGGRKLSTSAILRALIGMAQSLSLDLAGVETEAELRRRLLAARGGRRVR